MNPSQEHQITVQSDALERITQGIYRKNEELADTNRVLQLLRRIDTIVLSSLDSPSQAVQQIATAVTQDTGFPLAMMYLRSQSKLWLEPVAVAYRGTNQPLADRLRTEVMAHPISLKHPRNAAVRAAQQLFIVSTPHLYEATQPFLELEQAHELQEQLGLKSLHVCPLYARDEALGVMVLGSDTVMEKMGFHQRNMLERLTLSVGMALNDALLYATTMESANHLRQANRRLKELDKAKDEFISMASHQLRTPLTSIKGYLSLLADGDAGTLTETQQGYLAAAYTSTNHMVDLITDLLNVSRMQAGGFDLRPTELDLTAMVAAEIEGLEAKAEHKRLKLQFVAPTQPLPLLKLDETKTRQVIMNFIDNALYYTPEGAVTVTLKQLDGRVELRVSDTGIGVPRSARAKLFTKFYRAENAQHLRPDGTGLGLYMAKRVIEDQGGTIIFESEEGKGSTFGFSLPIKD